MEKLSRVMLVGGLAGVGICVFIAESMVAAGHGHENIPGWFVAAFFVCLLSAFVGAIVELSR